MHIRPMTQDDGREVAGLCQELGYDCSPAQITDRFQILPVDQLTLVAEHDGSIVGWVHAGRHQTLTSEPMVELLGLVITATHRHQGIGRALVAEAEAWARRLGCARVRVRSNLTREDALRFYERLGYRVTKSQRVFDKNLQVQST